VTTFVALQARLADAWALNTGGCETSHVVVALPSFSVASAACVTEIRPGDG